MQNYDVICSEDILTEGQFWRSHMTLAQFNKSRLSPQCPTHCWRQDVAENHSMLILEGCVLETERSKILMIAKEAPRKPQEFMKWFESLKSTGPGQNSPLFDWLQSEANYDQMKWFLQQEVAGEAGFDDLTAMTQVKFPAQAKLEMARNYWDEMGRGKEAGMHGPMLDRAAAAFNIEPESLDAYVPEALALANVLIGLAVNRRYAYHSVGALGAVELTAPGRAKKVQEGLKRLGISPEGQHYYSLHAAIDIKHSQDWNREVILPLVTKNPEIIPSIAEGALMRLNAGARCFDRYLKELNLMEVLGQHRAECLSEGGNRHRLIQEFVRK